MIYAGGAQRRSTDRKGKRKQMPVRTLSTDDGFAYRDLNKNGRLDPYEDPRLPIEERVEDLLGQLTLEEKAGPFAIANMFHGGDLDFKEEELTRILHVLDQVPTIVDIYLDRPAVIPEIAEKSAALLANFGASDAALLDVVFGRAAPQGTLPFELPSSMDAVRQQKEDVPYDSENPLFPFGYGLRY
jgi:beta-glucosidase